jgi:hypothetical protein
MTQLFGILGNKRHGKDTISDYLCKNYGFQKDAFAKPLKDVCQILFGFSNEQLYGNLKETTDPFWKISPRQSMQFIGTDLIRNQFHQLIPEIGDNFWLKSLESRIKSQKTVVSDVRYQNEVDCIHKLGGKVIKVVRKDVPIDFSHTSEALIPEIENYDFLIENNGSLEDLYLQIEMIITQCKVQS